MNIFVAKLSSRTKSEDLEQMFGEFGEVTSAKVIMDRETGNSKRFGFVEMSNDDEASMAIERLDDRELDGSHIVVKKARPREESGSRAGNGNRRAFRPSRF